MSGVRMLKHEMSISEENRISASEYPIMLKLTQILLNFGRNFSNMSIFIEIANATNRRIDCIVAEIQIR